MKTVAVIHGPNLNTLGTREPHLYGAATLAQIETRLQLLAEQLDVSVTTFQSNHEGALVDYIQALAGHADAILINPAGLTHTSVVLRDALLAAALPFVEVHLTNIYGRESFRRRSVLADVAAGVISGFGPASYELGLRALVDLLAHT